MAVTEVILHHFYASPFAEKVRLALGIKGLTWRSVEIPMVMPKPDLTALTGGYRKTPVMQIGADIYCDTQRIALELERRFPQPTLFPNGSQGLCLALSCWSDQAFFRPGAALSMGTNRELPEQVLSDRREFFTFLDFEKLEADLPHFYGQFSAHLSLVDSMLADGRLFILGHECAWADILAYFPVWMARGNISAAGELINRHKALVEWEKRVNTIGHGSPSEFDASSALEVARESESVATPFIEQGAFPVLAAGTKVTVTPDDYGSIPVEGALEVMTGQEVAIRREDDRAGEVVVHFPRVGYRVEIQE
jgi:glutathione S-transferase